MLRKIKKRKAAFIGIVLTALVSISATGTKAGQLDELISQALQANPDLKSAQARYKAFEARVPQAGALPDPMFMVNYANAPWRSLALDKMEMSGIELGLSQGIPLLKLGPMKNLARQMAEKERQDYNSLRNYVTSQVKQNFYDLFFWQKAIDITQQNKIFLEDLSKIASVKYSVGEGLQQDVLKAQVEVSMPLHQMLQRPYICFQSLQASLG